MTNQESSRGRYGNALVRRCSLTGSVAGTERPRPSRVLASLHLVGPVWSTYYELHRRPYCLPVAASLARPVNGLGAPPCASSAGEPLTPEVNEWATDALGTVVHDHYGQTETAMLINNHHHLELRQPVKVGSMGVVMPGWRGEVLLREADSPAPVGTVGRIVIRLADSRLAWFKGYEGEAEKTRGRSSPAMVFGT